MESCNLAKELAQVPDEIETDSQQSDDHESVERTNKKPDHRAGKGKSVPATRKDAPGKESLRGNVNKGKGRTNDAALNPIEAMVNDAVSQRTRRTERTVTPRAMEPIEQINPK